MIERFLKKKECQRRDSSTHLPKNKKQKTKTKQKQKNKMEKHVHGERQTSILPFGHIFPLPMLVIYSSFNLLKNKSPARGIHINYLGQYLPAHLLI